MSLLVQFLFSFIHTYISDWICKNLPIEFPINLDFLPHTNYVFWSSLKLHGHSVILKYNADLYGVWLRCEEHFSRPPPSHPRECTRPRSKKEASIAGFPQTVPFPPQNISLSRQTIIENGAIRGKEQRNKPLNMAMTVTRVGQCTFPLSPPPSPLSKLGSGMHTLSMQ